MLWRGRRESDNVVDRRGLGTGAAVGGAGLILALVYFLLTGDPSALLDRSSSEPDVGASGGRGVPTEQLPSASVPEDDDQVKFVRVVLADTEDVWGRIFHDMGKTYQPPKLVLFDGRIRSACGLATTAVGPFYCPEDREVYLDLSFFREMQDQLGAPGDFARAYVIAHEVGHHVQNLLGIMQAEAGRRSSVPLELQADCFAGVWAHAEGAVKHVLEPGDIEEALNAAAAVGDDRLQEETQGYVVPDSFTHGTSAQRTHWFSAGYRRGLIADCDTF